MRRISRSAAALALGVTLVAGACGSSDKAKTETSGGTFSMGIIEPANIDAAYAQETEGVQVIRLLFDGLTDYDEQSNVVPAVAKSWTVNADSTVFIFELRDDVKFHNGRKVVADDFVFALNRAANPKTASEVAYQGKPIKGWSEVQDGKAQTLSGVRAVDEDTLEITTAESFALLPKVLAHPVFSPVPKEALDTPDKEKAFHDSPVGNGAYQMDGAWKHNTNIKVKRFDDYYGVDGQAESIDFRIFSDTEPEVREVQAGTLDIGAITADKIPEVKAQFGDRLIVKPIAALSYIAFPNTKGPFAKPQIRQALSMAIDRVAIAERILHGAEVPAKGFVPDAAPGAVLDACPACAFNPAEAKRLYRAAGGIRGNRTTLHYAEGGNDALMEAIANEWKTNLGLTVRLEKKEFAAFLDEMDAGFDTPWALGWVWDYPSAYSFLSPLLSSTSTDNDFGYKSPAVDAALAKARTSGSEAAGLPALQEVQRLAAPDMPYAPLFFSADLRVHTARVSNVVISPSAFVFLERVKVAKS